jgi:hypothetical protein
MPTGRRSPISELELIELHVRTLYTHDDAGRLVAVNVRRRPPAARFFLGRTARGVRWPGQATHAGVETPPAFRGHGYAVIATAAWAQGMRDRGVIPLYGTSWTNRASQRDMSMKLRSVC